VANSGYVGWKAGEPNRAVQTQSDGTKVTESCGEIDVDGGHNDVACEWRYPYVCEFYRRPCVKPT